MKKRRILVLFLAIMVLAAMVQGCGNANGQPAGPTNSNVPGSTSGDSTATQKIKIGMSMGNIGDVFDRLLYEGVQKYYAEHPEIELIVLDAKGDVNTQISNVEQLINSKVDAILLWPYERDPLTVAVENANAKNIPVVCVNTTAGGGDFIYVGSDDVEAGRIQGEWLAENLPQDATYVYIMGPIGHSGQIGRKEGLEEVLSQKRPDIKKVAEQAGDWDRAKGLSITEDYLKSFPNLTAVVSQNDNMALGAVEALRTANLLGKIMVAGTDATEEACGKIKAGELAMSVFQNAMEQGYKSLEVTHKCALNEWKDGDLIIPFEAVDATNVDEYIARYEAVK